MQIFCLMTFCLSYYYYKHFRFISESRSSKLKKIALPLLLALKLKSTVIIPIVLKALAFLSVKALISGTLALILSSKYQVPLRLYNKHLPRYNQMLSRSIFSYSDHILYL